MKALLVISEVTFIPNNCQDFLEAFLTNNKDDIDGILILENFSLILFLKALVLYMQGAKNFAGALMKNMLTLPMAKRQSICKKFGIPLVKAKNVNNKDVLEWIKNEHIDLIINMRTRSLFNKEVLSLPRYGCVNIHHGILPKYRGLYCDLYALYEGRQAGFSIHKMTEKLDDGEILSVHKMSQKKEKNYLKYLSQLHLYEVEAITKLLDYIKEHNKLPQGVPNIDVAPIYTTTPSKKLVKQMIKGGMIL